MPQHKHKADMMSTAQAQVTAGANVQAQAQATGQHVGYIRVSSVGQNTERQLDNTKEPLSRIFTDQASGKDTNRPALIECMKYLREGDTLHVHSIDRLARSMRDLLNITKQIAEKGVVVKFEKEGLTFNDKTDPRSEFMLHMLSAVSQFERSLINERRAEGVAIAQRNGVKFGRPSKLTLAQRNEILARAADGNVNKKALAAEYGISRTVLYDILAEAAKDTGQDATA
jgi:DNA invertase Pin-like site-specific DNA recombinase